MSESFREATLQLAVEPPEANGLRIDQAFRLSANLDEFRSRRWAGETLQRRRVQVFQAAEEKIVAGIQSVEILGERDYRLDDLRLAREQIARQIVEAEERLATALRDWEEADAEFVASLIKASPVTVAGEAN